MSNKLRRLSSSAMTDTVTDFDKTLDADIDGEKRVKFENRRYKLIKVYSFFSSIYLTKIKFRLFINIFY